MLVLLAACGDVPQGMQKEDSFTNQTAGNFTNAQSAPVLEWSLERYEMIQLLIARNNAVSTFSLVWDEMRGKIRWSCPSVGYPIPGGTSLTNPQQLIDLPGTDAYASMPRMGVNGLYQPDTSYGTFVMCVNEDGTYSPIFIEDSVLAFPYPMMERNGQLVKVPGAQPSIAISPKPE
jgi:hypothetical protein